MLISLEFWFGNFDHFTIFSLLKSSMWRNVHTKCRIEKYIKTKCCMRNIPITKWNYFVDKVILLVIYFRWKQSHQLWREAIVHFLIILGMKFGTMLTKLTLLGGCQAGKFICGGRSWISKLPSLKLHFMTNRIRGQYKDQLSDTEYVNLNVKYNFNKLDCHSLFLILATGCRHDTDLKLQCRYGNGVQWNAICPSNWWMKPNKSTMFHRFSCFSKWNLLSGWRQQFASFLFCFWYIR